MIEQLHEHYMEKYDEGALIFIENRTKQYIQDGSDIESFWACFSSNYPELTDKTGIILDIQQLYTVSKFFKQDFTTEFSKIPEDSLIGAHIHERHNPPRFRHIPRKIWEYVADNQEWAKLNRPFHILPEVHNHSHVIPTYNFCKDFLKI